ncbi:D-aminoacyl-tRNA deacylase [Nocardia cyriacigeorgica]|uniref:D-aminoacyl-tRNA deacylase n=1 Tax=Nocardia cyriacigeorgica TaxID=135487 RepID=UPI00245822B4|nr:D-aminoacyl-tRNA deacylase [Nocardia cyriacigeorgica]
MRVLLQRVTSARVSVDGEVVGRIDPAAHGAPHGLVALVGVTHDDTEAAAAALADKLWRLRVLDGERSAADLDAPILVVSQFTLYADTKKGPPPAVWGGAPRPPPRPPPSVGPPITPRPPHPTPAPPPSGGAPAPGPIAEPLVDHFADALRALGATVATGRFGAHMHIELVNDGPVTLLLEG